jgi:uncharacterized protein YdhG (YjbR/CyaY superfamily)
MSSGSSDSGSAADRSCSNVQPGGTPPNKRMKLTSASPSRALVRVGWCARAARADARGRSQPMRRVGGTWQTGRHSAASRLAWGETGDTVASTDVNLVDAYIAKQPSAVQPVLQRVRRTIRKVLPKAEETVSYQIPAYKLHGQYVVYFAAWKQHWSLYPVTEPVRSALGSDLASHELSKGTVRFPLADPVPAKLVERIVRELAIAAEKRWRVKASSPSKQNGRRRRTRG